MVLVQLVISTIERYVGLTAAERECIAVRWHQHAFSKGASISRAGDVEERFYIVESGVQRMSFPHDGEDVCVGFSYGHSWCGAFDSFVSRKPSRFDVVALTDTVLVGIEHTDLQTLFATVPAMERWGRLILEELVVGRATREIEQLSLTAEQRYERLVARSPQLLQLVPQKDIASYLRMKPETLSRLRGRRS